MKAITLVKELEFHESVIRLAPGIIENARTELEFWDLYFTINPEGNVHSIDVLLDARKAIEIKITFISNELKRSEEFLEERRIDPSPITKEQIKELQTEFPEIFSRRKTLWIKKLFQKLFTKKAKKRAAQ